MSGSGMNTWSDLRNIEQRGRMMTESKANPKAKGTSCARKPRKPPNSATARLSSPKPKSPPRGGAKSKPGAEAKRATGKLASRLIDQRIRDLGDWREETLARMRALILQAEPEMIEERKWRKPSNAMAGVPVWSHNGIVCTGETYKNVVKLTFARGAGIPDPSRLFNSSLEGNTRRAIDIHDGETVDTRAFKALGEGRGGPEWLAGEETVDPEEQFANVKQDKAEGQGHVAPKQATQAGH